MWRLDVLPKTKVFGWRLLPDVLPLRINLISSFIDVDPICVQCGEDVETSEHVLQDCSWDPEFWERNCMTVEVRLPAAVELLHPWVARLMDTLKAEEQALFTTLLWCLWFAYNDLIF